MRGRIPNISDELEAIFAAFSICLLVIPAAVVISMIAGVTALYGSFDIMSGKWRSR